MTIIATEDNTGCAPRSHRWSAIDEATYDGAPDGHGIIGHGATKEEAIADLLEQIEEREEEAAAERERRAQDRQFQNEADAYIRRMDALFGDALKDPQWGDEQR